MSKERRGLAIIYDPHNLQQFAWYYYTYGKDIVWDALCLPNGYKGAYMEPYCERSGLFRKVMKDETEFMTLGNGRKLALFCKMTWYYITGRRRKCAKKILNEYVQNIDQYEEIVCLVDIGFISGLCAMLGTEKKVSYLDDGMGDYNPRSKWNCPLKKTSPLFWQGLILARMGYSCNGRFYFEPTKYCYKYCAVPDKMLYRNYREIHGFDMENTDVPAYNAALKRAYGELGEIDFESADAVFFTDNLEIFSPGFQEYYDKCTRVVGENSRTVLLKRHPRDAAPYHFPENVRVLEIDNAIPAEILLPYLAGKKIYFTFFSSIILFMQQYKYDYTMFYSEEFYRENVSAKNALAHFPSKEQMISMCNRFSECGYTLTEV